MRRYHYILLIAAFFTLILSQNGSAATITPDLQTVLDSAVPSQKVDVIVILKDRVNLDNYRDSDIRLRRNRILTALKDKANRTQTPVLDFLLARNSEKVVSLWLINGIGVTVRAGVIPLLARLPAVEEIRLNFSIPLAAPGPAPASSTPAEWNLDAVRAPDLWALGHTGQGIVIGSMDTGVDYRHLDLAGRWRGGPSPNSWYDPNLEHTTVPVDVHGHGTQTMGVMVGGDAIPVPMHSAIGVAPGAQWIAAKIFNDSGYASILAIHQGFQWMLDPDNNPATDDAPHVVNNSWGYPDKVNECFLEFQPDILALRAAGIAVVFSAGNSGPGTATSVPPANNPESFAVGSVAFDQTLAWDSSQGPSPCVIQDDFFPEVVAPGVNIKTADLTGGIDFDAVAWGFGTSFAAPHVSGAMALLMGAFPGKTLAELETALKNTAQDLGDSGPDDQYGYGQIDVLAAYRSLVPCTDSDNDGFYAEPACDVEPDCDDNDPDIYPGAPEINPPPGYIGDGIDQDCNGYDLTIHILGAQHLTSSDTLCVAATSVWADLADLALAGTGSMTWQSDVAKWSIVVDNYGGDPGQVEVTGIEGTVFSPTTSVSSDICYGDFDWSGGVETADLIVFAAGFGSTSGYDGSNLADFAASYGRSDCPMCY